MCVSGFFFCVCVCVCVCVCECVYVSMCVCVRARARVPVCMGVFEYVCACVQHSEATLLGDKSMVVARLYAPFPPTCTEQCTACPSRGAPTKTAADAVVADRLWTKGIVVRRYAPRLR